MSQINRKRKYCIMEKIFNNSAASDKSIFREASPETDFHCKIIVPGLRLLTQMSFSGHSMLVSKIMTENHYWNLEFKILNLLHINKGLTCKYYSNG